MFSFDEKTHLKLYVSLLKDYFFTSEFKLKLSLILRLDFLTEEL